MQFQITDGRGKETLAITIEAGAADDDGWRPLKVAKGKGRSRYSYGRSTHRRSCRMVLSRFLRS